MITKKAKKPTSVTDPQIDNRPIFNWPFNHLSFVLQEVKSTRQCSLTQPNTRTNSHSRPGRRSPSSTRTRLTGGRGSATERLEFSPATMLNHWNVSHLWIEHFESKQELKGSSSFFKSKNTFETPYCILHTITYLLLFSTSLFLQLWFVCF